MRDTSEFYFFKEEGNQLLKSEGEFLKKRRSMGVCLVECKLTEIVRLAVCCHVVKRRGSNKWFLEGV